MGGDEQVKPEHLCVFIHGLWGKPSHMKHLSKTLQAYHGKDNILTFTCESNSGNLTYDGIDTCAERAVQEIKDHIEELEKSGHRITRFSVVGYSLGGLVARFVIGLLDHEGFFKHRKPINFTTFASPHLGTRTPLSLWTSQIYNSLGPSLISLSGQQLFLMDDFRHSGKPLLELMADPNSIFIRALRKFSKRTLYANIINDRLAPFYTTAISSRDPYANADLSKLNFNYIEGYDPIVIDGSNPIKPETTSNNASKALIPSSRSTYILQTAQDTGYRLATILATTIVFPIFLTGFLANTTIETFRSQRRIGLHSSSPSRSDIPYLFLQRMASNISDKAAIFSRMPAVLATEEDRKREDTLTSPDPPPTTTPTPKQEPTHSQPETSSYPSPPSSTMSSPSASEDSDSDSEPPTKETPKQEEKEEEHLALLPVQFTMLAHLNSDPSFAPDTDTDTDAGEPLFTKFHVHFRQTRFSHAAMVVRRRSSWFEEGKTVSRHWVERRFDL